MSIEARAAFAALDPSAIESAIVERVVADAVQTAESLRVAAASCGADEHEPTSRLPAPSCKATPAARPVDAARGPGWNEGWFESGHDNPAPDWADDGSGWLERFDAANARGVTVAVKANIAVAGRTMSCASRMLAAYRPVHDATVVARLRARGAAVVGITNMDEFAMGSSGERSAFGATRNPWSPALVPGGSSSGSAAVVSRGDVQLALGSDSGGSVRQPAACCGVVGFKPSYGAVSRHGLAAYASSLDTVGFFARESPLLARAFAQVAGIDARDSTSADVALTAGPVGSWTFGVPSNWLADAPPDDPVAQALEQACATLEAAGARRVDVVLPSWRAALAAYSVLSYAEAASNLSRYNGVYVGRGAPGASWSESVRAARTRYFGLEVKRRLLLGAGYLVEQRALLDVAQRVRSAVIADSARALADVDVLLLPTSPHEPFRFDEQLETTGGMTDADRYTVPANLAGLPAISVPWIPSGGTPSAVQLIGRRFEDARLLALAMEVERARGPLALAPGAVS